MGRAGSRSSHPALGAAQSRHFSSSGLIRQVAAPGPNFPVGACHPGADRFEQCATWRRTVNSYSQAQYRFAGVIPAQQPGFSSKAERCNEALRSARLQRLSDMIGQARRTTAASVLLVCLCLAQQNPVIPSFHAETNLVTVPFQVRRGSRSVSDLKPSDVVLLEDGVPRSFTIFEAPPAHLTLDLVVMFDITNPGVTVPKAGQKGRAGFWDTKALQDLADYWNEAITRRLLDGQGVSIRFSIYRFDQFRLQRLCQSTGDPRGLADALHRLAGPGPTGQAAGQEVDISLPAGLAIRNMERKAQSEGNLPQPWSLAGAVSVLKDSAVASSPREEETGANRAKAARALVIFSTGAEGTSITPQDLADQAVAAGVPIYPVALPGFPSLVPYEGYTYRVDSKIGVDYFYPSKQEQAGGNQLSMLGPGGADFVKCRSGNCGHFFASYYNYPFELLGDLTGGLRFDAMNHLDIPDADTPGLVLFLSGKGYSMTGGEADHVLERVKKHASARFSSNYTVGFVPSLSDSPRAHKLEVKLGSKSGGKVTEGKRSATY
ncbi:MAG TPA: hypothetical protein VKB88_24050 [Bryobacteraceae bacterium]|nr:hypothetical protein [Bryobacteraceae bacterium]